MDRVLAAVVISIIAATFASAAALQALKPEQRVVLNITARELIVEGSIMLTSSKALREYRYKDLVLIIPPVSRVQLNFSLTGGQGSAGLILVDCPKARLVLDRVPVRVISVGGNVLVQFATLPHMELSSLNPSIEVDLVVRVPSGAIVSAEVNGVALSPRASIIIKGFRCSVTTPPVVIDLGRGVVYGEALRVEVADVSGVKVYKYEGRPFDPLLPALSSALGAVIAAAIYEYLKSKHAF